jgi:hypothetical protein
MRYTKYCYFTITMYLKLCSSILSKSWYFYGFLDCVEAFALLINFGNNSKIYFLTDPFLFCLANWIKNRTGSCTLCIFLVGPIKEPIGPKLITRPGY